MPFLKKILYIYKSGGAIVLSKRILRKITSYSENSFEFLKDTYGYTFTRSTPKELYIKSYLKGKLDGVTKLDQDIINNFLHHKFDLLGSDWVEVAYGISCSGNTGKNYSVLHKPKIDSEGEWLKERLNFSSYKQSKEVWKCVDTSYKPIDWQLDFKSGYRWSEHTWYKSITFLDKQGADVKVPWELARMQHLPMLARQYVAEQVTEEEKKALYFEFRNQILDFIATNPPKWGVNWSCSMDIAIRAANWLLAYDIFASGGCKFDPEFKKIFSESIFCHGQHIFKNLEWNFGDRGNHYLTNICGLIFIGCYLSNNLHAREWLSYCIEEFTNEVDYQFYDEGTNFEGSTAYHLLTSEMILYTTSLLIAFEAEEGLDLDKKVDKKPNSIIEQRLKKLFSKDFFQKLHKISNFLEDISKCENKIPQIGDNDSGRFFKLEPIFTKTSIQQAREKYFNLNASKNDSVEVFYFKEDLLDCSHLKRISDTLFYRVRSVYFDCKIMSSYLQNADELKYPLENDLVKGRSSHKISEFYSSLLKTLRGSEPIYKFISEKDLSLDIYTKAYEDFGLYVFKSQHLYLSFRCWPGKEPYKLGHMHYDQLSIELVIDGESLVLDPGSYLYSPDIESRWNYRSPEAHFSPFSGDDIPTHIKDDPFSPAKPQPMEVIYRTDTSICARYEFNGEPHYYLIDLSENRLSIYSSCNSIKIFQDDSIQFSEGYGVKLNVSS